MREVGEQEAGELVGVEAGAPLRRVEEDLGEGQQPVDTVGVRVRRQEFRERIFRWLFGTGGVLRDELQLLAQTPADDRVVPVEAQGDALPVQDLFADVILDEALQLLPGLEPALLADATIAEFEAL